MNHISHTFSLNYNEYEMLLMLGVYHCLCYWIILNGAYILPMSSSLYTVTTYLIPIRYYGYYLPINCH